MRGLKQACQWRQVTAGVKNNRIAIHIMWVAFILFGGSGLETKPVKKTLGKFGHRLEFWYGTGSFGIISLPGLVYKVLFIAPDGTILLDT